MTRELIRMSDADVPALMTALRAALDGSGPAILPTPSPTPTPLTPAPALTSSAGRVAAAGGVSRPLAAPPAAPSASDLVPDEVALVIETSGSTGTPKRVGLSAPALLASAAASAEWVAAHAAHAAPAAPARRTPAPLTGKGQWLLCLPGHYVAGTNVLVRSIHAGTEPVVMSPGHFDARAFAELATRLTAPERYASLVPVQLARLVEAAESEAGVLAVLRRFDALLIGGQALRPELRERCTELGIRVVRTYGSSETSGGCVYDGEPIGATRARVVPIATELPGANGSRSANAGASAGALELSGPTLAVGYLGDAARTAAAFDTDPDGTRWYRTGDLGEVAADGRVTVLGRVDNVIISGGEKVLLDAVERHVKSLPGLADAVVVVADDAQWGQVPVVVATTSVELAGIRSSTAAALGRAAAPARVVVLDAIPHLASGKPDRLALTQLAAENR